ncbi:MAG: cytochrome c [Silvibacterium sp.]|nr:cytochrome c [Silvibacterium sp.]
MCCRRLTLVAFASFLCICFSGCRSTPPGKLETKSVQWVKHHVTVRGKKDRNPLEATEERIQAGRRVFGYYCVVCHGRDGQNTGVPFAAKVSPPVPSLADKEVQSYTDGQLKWIIDNGIFPSGMPASHGTLSDDEMWQVVLYIRHLPPAGSLGEPRAYSGDEYQDSPDTKN